ncbi:hypothetical protein SAMN05421690_10409 [Nitrosomonas sp. Nm51]|uniref:hypothetical protein n=1 Tax=Nitrosomonas sp. Nm51 TaxID=133720 RepID=UPI0008AEDC07|nr:hypothetical protein [Nitrosomonas sp. Nm51]SER58064.1 hypothetical protein SAMN05421690_10409 [Nitrosomonas sp. Nm51]
MNLIYRWIACSIFSKKNRRVWREKAAHIIVSYVIRNIYPAYATGPEHEQLFDETGEDEINIMPLDLEKTNHFFTKTEEGGVQQVVAKNRQDLEQIRLIRKHLYETSTDLSQDCFSRLLQILGENMPGLTELEAPKADQIKIEYLELQNGAQISYSSDSPPIIEAIHKWIEAQFNDHPRQVISGHAHSPKLNH